MSAPNNLEQLIEACKASNRKERLKSVTKDAIADILASHVPQEINKDDLGVWMRRMTESMDELKSTNQRLLEVMDRMEKIENELGAMRIENGELNEQLKKQSEVIREQQRFLERLDQKERTNNLLILGASEGAESSVEVSKRIIGNLGEEAGSIAASITNAKRIGELGSRPGTSRPLLVVLPTAKDRNRIVELGRKNSSLQAQGIHMKKDSHPAVRAEWKRLFGIKDAEAAKPENAGRSVTLDWKKRQVTVDGQVVASWGPLF